MLNVTPSLEELTSTLIINLEIDGYENDYIMSQVEILEKEFDLIKMCRISDNQEVGYLSKLSRQTKIPYSRLYEYAKREGNTILISNLIKSMRRPDLSHLNYLYEDKKRSYFLGSLFGRLKNYDLSNKTFPFVLSKIDCHSDKKILDFCQDSEIPYLDYHDEIRLKHCHAIKEIGDFISNRDFPWEYLVTLNERKQFLSGFLDGRGSILNDKRGNQVLFKLRLQQPFFYNDLLFLFSEVGITPHYTEKKNEIIIRTKEEVRLIKDILTSETKKEKFDVCLTVSNEPEVGISLSQCIGLYEFKQKFPNKNAKIFYQQEGIQILTGQGRSLTKSMVARASRFLRLQKLKETYFDYNVIGYCCRSLRLSSEASRTLSKVYGLGALSEFNSRDIKAWAERYDKNPRLNVEIVENSLPLNLEIKCYGVALSVANGKFNAQKANQKLRSFTSREVPYKLLRSKYTSFLSSIYSSRKEKIDLFG